MAGLNFDTKVTLGHPPGTNGNWNDVGGAINSGLQQAYEATKDHIQAQKEAFGKFADAIGKHLDPERLGKLSSLEASIGLGQVRDNGMGQHNVSPSNAVSADLGINAGKGQGTLS